MITVASFRQDLPEFASKSVYPDGVIQYWLAAASILLGVGSGSPQKVCSFVGALAINNVLAVSEVDFGSLTMLPLSVQGNKLPVNAAIVEQLTGAVGGIGTYQMNVAGNIVAEPMVALGSPIGNGSNNFWGPSSPTVDSPPTTLADLATEQWVAHQIVLEKQALDAARTGADPGTKIGVVNNKSVNGVSIGFDVSAVTGGKMQENGGYYNQTIYGQRFYRLMKLRGAGPIQIGIGIAPPFLFFNNWGLLGASNAWGGPYPGVAPADTGFSS